MNICPSNSSLAVAVRVKIHSLLGVRLAENVGSGEIVNFDVNAQMEEKERRIGQISVTFALKVGTKPSIVKYEVDGVAMLEGKDEEIKKMLEVNPETQIPFVFQRVYQNVFMSMYLLATLIDAPYPPSNLLHSSQQPMSIAQISASIAATTATEEKTMQTVVAAPREERTLQQPPTNRAPQERTAAQPAMVPREETTTPIKEQKVGATAEAQQSNLTQRDREEQAPET